MPERKVKNLASKLDPDYSAVIVSKDGPRYDITPLMTGVDTNESEGQIAARATVSFFNALSGTKYMNQLIRAMDRLFLYANDGGSPKEVFRGYIWEIEYSSELEKILSVTAYDKVHVTAGNMVGDFFVTGVNRKIRSDEKMMTLTCIHAG